MDEEIEKRVQHRLEDEKKKERLNISQELIDYIDQEFEQRAEFFTHQIQ